MGSQSDQVCELRQLPELLSEQQFSFWLASSWNVQVKRPPYNEQIQEDFVMLDSTDSVHAHSEDIRRLTRALRTIGACNRALLRAGDEQELLNEICHIVVEEGGYRLTWVSRAEHDEASSVVPIAQAGFDEGYVESLYVCWSDTERGRGATGTAIRTGQPSVIRNILTDPKVAIWRDAAVKRGYASLLSLPLRVEGEIFGAITIAAPEPDAFDDEEFRLLEDAAEDLAYGLSMLRTRARAKKAEDTVRKMAYYDSLTGLPNRAYLRERLEQAIAAAKENNSSLALLVLEICHFRQINETLGYSTGDALLREVAARLNSGILDSQEMVARMGDSEFAILLSKGGAKHARRLAEKILGALAPAIELSGGLMSEVGPIVGITLFPGHGSNPDTLMRRANVALLAARCDGAGFAFYTAGLEEEHTRRFALMCDLRRAIENDELLLYYQPKVDMRSRKICGAEALVRWPHPQFGMVNPAEFIKLAENAGLITSLTYWVLDAVLRQCYAWHEAGFNYPVAVNLCARDLRDPDLLNRIAGAFETWGARPEWVQFELTESSLMEDPNGSLLTLERLTSLGVEIFLDDFGTGYSSLSYLQRLPIDSIKIDQSFVSKMTVSEDSCVIVSSAIELAHHLKLNVVAEGVEDDATWKLLDKLGCDVSQGYVIAEPISAGQFKDWVAQSPWH
jgi:diguanylate cyclase (GGDEF)-like protein